jgi:amidase
MSETAALAGYPNMSIPMGAIDGMPIGLSMTGPAWSEPTMIGIAYAYEAAAKKRVAPTAYKAAAQ